VAKVKLKDGSIVDIDIDPTWGEEAVQRAIREYKANADRADDSWGEFTDKQVKSAARGGGAGLATTADMAKNFLWDAPGNAINWARGAPGRGDLFDSPVRDAYEANVIAQPPGYENTARVAEIVVPAIAESLLTGSPKTALLRAGRDAGLGIAGGELGGTVGGAVGGEQGEALGRLLGSAVGPGAGTRTGIKAATLKTGGPILSRAMRNAGLGHLDPYNLIPATSPLDLAGRAAVGSTGAATLDYGQDAAEEERRRMEAERYRKMTGG